MQFIEKFRQTMGWCPNAPSLRTAPAVLDVRSLTVNPAQPGSSGAGGGPGRIRRGISIATGSIMAIARDKRLLWYSFLAGLVILFLIVAEGWIVTHVDSALPALIFIPFENSSFILFDIRLFLIEAVCLSCFTLLLAALVWYRNRSRAKTPVTIREGFDGINTHAGPLSALAIAMALVATVLFEISSQSQVVGKAELGISLALFHIPYAYYIPNEVFSALYFAFQIMVVNIVLFLLALYVVPVIVLDNKGLFPALAGSVSLMKKTWRELLGCVLIFGAVFLGVAAVALLIGGSHLLLNNDYDFFLSVTRGRVLMTVVSSGFLLACGVLMAVGSTILGIAITDLYSLGKTCAIPHVPRGDAAVDAEPVL